jgi:UDP-N-acetylmuramate--alanine ligase
MSSQADFQIRDVEFSQRKSRFKVYHRGQIMGTIDLNLPGIHNVYNATASIAVGVELDVDFDHIKAALEKVEGVQRRLEIKGETNDITVIDDYGHHPTEIKVTLEAIEENWPDRRKVIIFQPHRYSRTQALFDEFSRAFYQSDVLVVMPIYAASEKRIEGVSSKNLCEQIKAHGHKEVIYADGFKAAFSYVKNNLLPGDVLLTLGAGDVWKVGEAVVKKF